MAIDKRKVFLFRQLLKEAFAGDEVRDGEDFEPDCWFYRVSTGTDRRHRIRVTSDFFEDNDEAAIRSKFRGWDLANVIRGAGAHTVLITNTGPEVVPE